jgi:hypothetical protein
MVVRGWHVMLLASLAIVALGAIAAMRLGHSASKSASVPMAAVDDAARQAAEANVQPAVPMMAAYFAEHGTYENATTPGLGPTVAVVVATATAYCVQSTVHGATASITGPSGAVVDAPCA